MHSAFKRLFWMVPAGMFLTGALVGTKYIPAGMLALWGIPGALIAYWLKHLTKQNGKNPGKVVRVLIQVPILQIPVAVATLIHLYKSNSIKRVFGFLAVTIFGIFFLYLGWCFTKFVTIQLK